MIVCCVYWRDPSLPDDQQRYRPEHVYRLRDQVAAHLPVEHRFLCVTAEELEGVETIDPPVPYPGWWQKIGLFSSKMPQGPKLYFDLDVAIVGDLGYLLEYFDYVGDGLASPANWAQSGHGGIQSSVMLWEADLSHVCDLFNPESARWPPVNQPGILWGDQEMCTLLRDTGQLEWTAIRPEWVLSWKYHCKQGVPDDCLVCVFHGSPKPWEVNEPWMS